MEYSSRECTIRESDSRAGCKLERRNKWCYVFAVIALCKEPSNYLWSSYEVWYSEAHLRFPTRNPTRFALRYLKERKPATSQKKDAWRLEKDYVDRLRSNRVQSLLTNLHMSNEDLYMVLPPSINRNDLESAVAEGLVAKIGDNAGSLETLGSESRKAASEVLEEGKQIRKLWQQERARVYSSVASIADLAISCLNLPASVGPEWQLANTAVSSEFDEDVVSTLSDRKPRDITIVNTGERVSDTRGTEVLIEWPRNEDEVTRWNVPEDAWPGSATESVNPKTRAFPSSWVYRILRWRQ